MMTTSGHQSLFGNRQNKDEAPLAFENKDDALLEAGSQYCGFYPPGFHPRHCSTTSFWLQYEYIILEYNLCWNAFSLFVSLKSDFLTEEGHLILGQNLQVHYKLGVGQGLQNFCPHWGPSPLSLLVQAIERCLPCYVESTL